MNSVDDTDAAIESFALGRCGYSHAVLFRAAKAFFEYRKNDNGERKTGALPDFLIGALAEVEAAPLITRDAGRSEEHTSELQSLMRISYAVFCFKNKKRATL